MNNYTILNKAKLLALSFHYEEALKNIDRVLLNNPENIDAIRFKGNVIELKNYHESCDEQPVENGFNNNLQEAKNCYEKVILLQPEHVGALVDLGTLLNNINENKDALENFDKAISIIFKNKKSCFNDELIEALEGKIEIFEKLGETEKTKPLLQLLKEYAQQA